MIDVLRVLAESSHSCTSQKLYFGQTNNIIAASINVVGLLCAVLPEYFKPWYTKVKRIYIWVINLLHKEKVFRELCPKSFQAKAKMYCFFLPDSRAVYTSLWTRLRMTLQPSHAKPKILTLIVQNGKKPLGGLPRRVAKLLQMNEYCGTTHIMYRNQSYSLFHRIFF